MELVNSNISERQLAYRAEYRRRIDGWYNGFLHVAVIYTIGIMANIIFITHISAVTWWE